MTAKPIVALAVLLLFGLQSHSNAQVLGTANSFAVLAGSAVTNTGMTHLTGNLGIWPNNAITGFPPGHVNGTTHAADGVARQAQDDLTTAYNYFVGETFDQNLSGQDLGGMTLAPGVYKFASSAQLTGTLTLDAQNNPFARFVFQIGSTLTTETDSRVRVINNGSGCNVFWQVGSSATIDTGTQLVGHILAFESITLNTGASIIGGSALARNGAVTMDTNTISNRIAMDPVVLHPIGYIVVEGYEVGGDLQSLMASDDDKLLTYNDDQSLACVVEFYTAVPFPCPLELSFTTETSVGRYWLSQSHSLYNYTTYRWDEFSGLIAPTVDTLFTTTVTNSAMSYINGTNGETRARVRWQPINDEDPSQDGWPHWVDEASWLVQ